jgi:hypothetical protein
MIAETAIAVTSASQAFARLVAALVAALREPRRREPYLLVIEDAPCADEATRVLIRHLARRVHGCRALVCLSDIDPKTRRQGIGCASCSGTPLPRLAAAGSTFATLARPFRLWPSSTRGRILTQHPTCWPPITGPFICLDLAAHHCLRARLVLAAPRHVARLCGRPPRPRLATRAREPACRGAATRRGRTASARCGGRSGT